ncbi:MAG: hypothetical protein JO022_09175, partial [Acidobacteriaceae bacterium]|nr:hypothetical protein [Acidobacteriaceae bacterium]
MDFLKLFDGKSRQLFWRRVDASHCNGGVTSNPIEANQAYFTVRLCEMFLASSRKLWREMYPMVYSFTSTAAGEYHSVASPAQLQDLGNTNLERLENLNFKLCGPLP